MVKKESGKSTVTKVISVRVLNKDHASLVKLAGGKKRLSGFVRRKLEDIALNPNRK